MKQKQKGISVVIVVLLITVMLAFATGSSMMATSTFRQIGRAVSANQAYYAAEGALEEALKAANTYNTGYTKSDISQVEIKGESLFSDYADDCLAQNDSEKDDPKPLGDKPFGNGDDTAKPKDTNPNNPTGADKNPTGSDKNDDKAGGNIPINCDSIDTKSANAEVKIKAEWKMIGASPQDLNYKVQLTDSDANDPEAGKFYTIPVAGTGSAGGTLCEAGKDIPIINGDANSGMKKFVTAYNKTLSTLGLQTGINDATPAADHPCHWSKLYVSNVGDGDKPGNISIPFFTQEEADVDGNGIKDILIKNPANSYWINGAQTTTGKKAEAQLVTSGQYLSGLGFDENAELYIRFRTPCKPVVTNGETTTPEMCNPSDRYQLDTSDGNDVVISWKIEEQEPNPCGTFTSNSECSAGAPVGGQTDPHYKTIHSVGPIMPQSKGADILFGYDVNITLELGTSTEIREGIINEQKTIPSILYAILSNKTPHLYTDLSNKISLLDLSVFLRNFSKKSKNFPINNLEQWRLYKPALNLVNVHTLDADGGGNVPYLEYQILTSTNFQPFSDAYQTFFAQAIVNGLKQTIKVKFPNTGSSLQYVIQQ